MEELIKLKDHPGVRLVQGHMCAFRMTAPEHGKDSEHLPVKKPTGFLTSSECIAQELNKVQRQPQAYAADEREGSSGAGLSEAAVRGDP